MGFTPGQLEAVLQYADTLPDDAARRVAREVATHLLELHRTGLTRLVELIREAGDAGRALLDRASEDELIGSLLLLHDIHPVPLEARVTAALARARVVAGGKASRIELIAVERGRVRIQVEGDAAIREMVARVVQDAAPDAETVELIQPPHDLVQLQRRHPAGDEAHGVCELCGQRLGTRHPHLLDPRARTLSCACDACGVLFDSTTDRGYRRVRPKAARLGTMRMSETTWVALGVPVKLAFFSRVSSTGAVVAAYPGPAGAVEAEVMPGAWDVLVAEHPELRGLEPDVEALLVNRLKGEAEHYRVSIDWCYRLTGAVRSRWQGISGGDGVPAAIADFFHSLSEAQA